MTKIKTLTCLIMATVFLNGCAMFGDKPARKEFKYEKSPCACKEDGTFFNGQFYPRKTA